MFAAKPASLRRVDGEVELLGFSLQVPAVMDAAIDVAGGRVNIHVLMAVAAFASVVMGNALEGGLLLAMFSLSHQGEQSRMMIVLSAVNDLHH